jgi:hypothetical protein
MGPVPVPAPDARPRAQGWEDGPAAREEQQSSRPMEERRPRQQHPRQPHPRQSLGQPPQTLRQQSSSRLHFGIWFPPRSPRSRRGGSGVSWREPSPTRLYNRRGSLRPRQAGRAPRWRPRSLRRRKALCPCLLASSFTLTTRATFSRPGAPSKGSESFPCHRTGATSRRRIASTPRSSAATKDTSHGLLLWWPL